MLDGDLAEKTRSDRDVDEGDGEPVDADTLAFRDAMHDIWASEGRFEVLLP